MFGLNTKKEPTKESTEQPKDISEPVISILQAMDDRPRDFKVYNTRHTEEERIVDTTTVIDIKTKLTYTRTEYKVYITEEKVRELSYRRLPVPRSRLYIEKRNISFPFSLTQDEYITLNKKLQDIRNTREKQIKTRRDSIRRERILKLYQQ